MISRLALVPSHAYRWNYTVMGLDITVFVFGMSFSSAATILPLFVHHLTSSNVALGLIQGVRSVGYNFPPILVAGLAQRLARKKGFMLGTTVFERVPYLILAASALLLARDHPTLLLLLFFLMLAILGTAGGLCMPAWLDIVARAIPDDWRGRFFGLSSALGGLLGVVGAALATGVLQRFAYPTNFALLFTLTFACMVVSFILLALCREPAPSVQAEPAAQGSYLRALPEVLRRDRNFRRYLVIRALTQAAGMGAAFYAVDVERTRHLTDAQAGIYAVVLLAATTLGNLIWGYVGDHAGHKRIVEIASACLGLAALLAIAARAASDGTLLFGVVFVLAGLGTSGIQLTEFAFVVDFAPDTQRPTYIGLATLCESPFAIGAPLIGGLIGDRLGLPIVYALTATIAAVAVALTLATLTDPRLRARHAQAAAIEERTQL